MLRHAGLCRQRWGVRLQRLEVIFAKLTLALVVISLKLADHGATTSNVSLFENGGMLL